MQWRSWSTSPPVFTRTSASPRALNSLRSCVEAEFSSAGSHPHRVGFRTRSELHRRVLRDRSRYVPLALVFTAVSDLTVLIKRKSSCAVSSHIEVAALRVVDHILRGPGAILCRGGFRGACFFFDHLAHGFCVVVLIKLVKSSCAVSAHIEVAAPGLSDLVLRGLGAIFV